MEGVPSVIQKTHQSSAQIATDVVTTGGAARMCGETSRRVAERRQVDENDETQRDEETTDEVGDALTGEDEDKE